MTAHLLIRDGLGSPGSAGATGPSAPAESWLASAWLRSDSTPGTVYPHFESPPYQGPGSADGPPVSAGGPSPLGVILRRMTLRHEAVHRCMSRCAHLTSV